MATPPSLPSFDKRKSPDVAGHHALLEPFLKDTSTALNGALTLRENVASLVRGPILVKVPDDWVQVPFSANWANFGGAERPFQYRKTADGVVKARGSWTWTGGGTPAAGTIISALTSEIVTDMQETMIVLGQAPAATGHVTIASTGLYYQSGPILALSSTGLEWTAANRQPPAWGAPFPLFFEWNKPPALVLVDAAQVDSNNRPSGSRVSLVAEWKPAKQGGKEGFHVTRLPGLSPTTSYSVTVYALAG